MLAPLHGHSGSQRALIHARVHELTPRVSRLLSSEPPGLAAETGMGDRPHAHGLAFVLGYQTALDCLMEIASMGQKAHWNRIWGSTGMSHMTKCVHKSSQRQTGQDQGPITALGRRKKGQVSSLCFLLLWSH